MFGNFVLKHPVFVVYLLFLMKKLQKLRQQYMVMQPNLYIKISKFLGFYDFHCVIFPIYTLIQPYTAIRHQRVVFLINVPRRLFIFQKFSTQEVLIKDRTFIRFWDFFPKTKIVGIKIRKRIKISSFWPNYCKVRKLSCF